MLSFLHAAGWATSGRTNPFCPLAIGDRGLSWHASGADSIRSTICPPGRRLKWVSASWRLKSPGHSPSPVRHDDRDREDRRDHSVEPPVPGRAVKGRLSVKSALE